MLASFCLGLCSCILDQLKTDKEGLGNAGKDSITLKETGGNFLIEFTKSSKLLANSISLTFFSIS